MAAANLESVASAGLKLGLTSTSVEETVAVQKRKERKMRRLLRTTEDVDVCGEVQLGV